MSMVQQAHISAVVGLLGIVALIVLRKRIGVLNAASWLVVWGAVVLFGEHPQFSLAYAAGIMYPEAQQLVLIPHARIHFFMAGIYATVGLILLGVIARTLLRAGHRVGWYAILFVAVVGGGFELVMGGRWFQHGSPLYLMERPLGIGWEFLYVYLVAWIAALVLSYKPLFAETP